MENIKITKKSLVYRIIIFIFILLSIKPEGIEHYSKILSSLLWPNVFNIFLFFTLVFMLVIKNNVKKCKKIIPLIILLIAPIIITYLNNGNIFIAINRSIGPLNICLVFINFYDYKLEVLDSLEFYLFILIVADIISIIIMPEGAYRTLETHYDKNWLLGYKSSLQYYVYPYLYVIFLKINFSKFYVKELLGIIICIIVSYLSGNMMLLSCILFTSILIIVKQPAIARKYFNYPYFIMIVSFFVNAVIVFYSEYIFKSKYGYKLFAIMGKEFTLGGRTTIIWPNAIHFINNRWILGYGILDSETARLFLGMPSAIHTHNQILEFLFNGGVVLLGIYVFVCVNIANNLSKQRYLQSSWVSAIWILGLQIMILIEIFTREISAGIWLCLCFSLYTKEVEKTLSSFYGENNFFKGLKFRKVRRRLTNEIS